MPISSTQIQNILATQVGMFASSAQYAQAVSAQYGYQPSGSSVDDPRNARPLQAGMMASGAVRAADIGAGGLGMAAMLGMAPRMFDPMTATIGAAASGYGAAGAAGAIGMGVATGGAYLALGSIYRWSADQLVIGAQQRGMLNYQMGQLAPNMGAAQLGQMSAMVSGAARMGMGSIQDISSMMQAGAADGSLNTQSITQFQQSFQKLLGNVRQVATALSTTLTEAQQAMAQVKSLGISSDQAGQFLGSMRMIGQGAGLSPQQMYGIAAQGTAFGRQLGINPQGAAMGAMINQGVLGMVEKGGLIEGVGLDSYGRYSQGAMRFLGSAPGQRVLAAMMTEGGGLNQEVAAQIASGAMSRQDIQRMATQNLGRRGMRDILNARSGELAGEFISQYGPQAINPALQAMTSGGLYGQNPESMRAMLTGLTRSELGQMGDLNRMMPSLRSRLMEEGRAGFQEGSRRASLSESLDAQIGQLVAPFKDRLRQYGADLTQSIQQTIEGVTRDFIGAPPQSADPSVYARYMRQYIRGGGTNNLVYRRAQPFMEGMGGGGFMNPSIPQAQSFLGGMPSGLRIGSMGAGVGLEDLPFYGLGTESYNPAITAAAAATFGGSASIAARLGRGLGAAGLGITEATAIGGTGFMGLGGYGAVTGSLRAGGFAMRGAGLALRGAGLLGAGITAYDVATNLGPAASRSLGYSPITEGAVLGDQANLIQYMSDQDMLGGARLQARDVGMFGINEGNTDGLTPVGGLLPGRGMFEPGRQMMANAAVRSAYNRFVSREAPGIMGRFAQRGAAGQRALEFATLSSGRLDFQAKELARRTGMSEAEARGVITATAASGVGPAAGRAFNEDAERAKLLKGNTDEAARTLYTSDIHVNAHNNAMQAMDKAITSGKNLPTLDRFMADLEEQGVALDLTSDDARLELLRYFNTLGVGTTATNVSTVEGILARTIGPKGPGTNYMELVARSDAKAFLDKQAEDIRRLNRESVSAGATGRLAAVGGMFPASIMQDYVRQFTGEDDRGRLGAMGDLFKRLALDPTVTGTGLMKATSMMARDPSEAMQRAAIGAQTIGQFKALQKRGATGQQMVEQIIGADLSGISRQALKANFGDMRGRINFDTNVEAAITQEFMEMQKARLGPGDQPSEQAARQMTGRLFDALQNMKNDPSKLAGLMSEIATMRAQAGGGSRPGDVAKNMEELVSRLSRFSDSVDNAKRRLDQFSGEKSSP